MQGHEKLVGLIWILLLIEYSPYVGLVWSLFFIGCLNSNDIWDVCSHKHR